MATIESEEPDLLDGYDIARHRRGRRKWIALMILGLVVIVASIAASVVISGTGGTDAPGHDRLFPLPLLVGSAAFAAGAVILAMGRLVPKAIKQRKRAAMLSGALLLTTLIICGYILNPLISPISILRDSDLDGVQDYSDDYPNNHSRVDRPWIYFMMYTHVSYGNEEWNVSVGRNGYSCWLDAISIEIRDPDSGLALGQTLLTQLSGDTQVDGVRYYNTAKHDRLDEGDYFMIDRHEYTEGSRIIILGATETGWQILTQNLLATTNTQ